MKTPSILCTTRYDLVATWLHFSEKWKTVPRRNASPETKWFYARVKEAIAAWERSSERRLIILVRIVIGALWMDSEVTASLATLPDWWTATEPIPPPQPTLEQGLRGRARITPFS